MAQLNTTTISRTTASTVDHFDISQTIVAGDTTGAYILELIWSDVTTITGTCQLNFEIGTSPKTYATRDASDGVVVSGNKITYTLDSALYAAAGLVCWVSFINDAILHTPLRIKFTAIVVPGSGDPVSTAQTYPSWAADMIDYDISVGTVTTLAEGESATASITGAVPDKLLNLGIPIGATGATGATGTTGATGPANTLAIGTVTTVAAGGSATASVTGAAPNQTLNLGIPAGVAGGDITTAAELPIVDAGSYFATDNVEAALQSAGAQLAQKVPLTRQTKYWNRPAAYRIQVAAGRFNMSWNNANGRMWVFPVGTVLYSDGTTLIRTSTAEKPDVIIPTGGGYVWLASAAWNGLYALLANDTTTRLTGALSSLPPLTYNLDLTNCSLITGALSDLPPLTYRLILSGCPLVTGALSDLPPLTYSLELTGCPLVTGALSDLPPLTYALSLTNCSLVTGALSDLPPLTYFLILHGCSLITGALSSLPPLTNYLILHGCSLITGAYTAVNGNNVPTTTTLTGTGLSSTDMDNTLIAYAACTKNNGTFTATGKTRTAASDAAVATLTGRGWTISGITKV